MSSISSNKINFWWVNQGKSLKKLVEAGCLWAPSQDRSGRKSKFYNDLFKVNIGDVIFVYSNSNIQYVCIANEHAINAPKPSSLANHEWGQEGIKLKVTYFPMKTNIHREEIPLKWRLDNPGPFDVNGNVKMNYFYSVNERFALKLILHFTNYFSDEIIEKVKDVIQKEKVEKREKDQMEDILSTNHLLNHIYEYIRFKGFYYQIDDIKNLFLCLKSKPFVILSGISGTGKTKLVQLFAESVGANKDNGQFTLIPVRPDWSDGSDLIGYTDLAGEYKPGPLTEILKQAKENPDKPYFILLDEMNLARVEYYFSDLLSIMETKEYKEGSLRSHWIPGIPEKIMLLDNVYIIGTVNMDETTHSFSKKVLDRANTIEFNEVQLQYFDFLKDKNSITPMTIRNDQLKGRFLTLKDAYEGNEELIQRITGSLVEINKILEEINAHFAYRVRDEICFYMIYNNETKLLDENKAFDYQIMQKILPRISGSDIATEVALKRLFKFCTNHEYNSEMDSNFIFQEAKYPKSAKKIHRMLQKIESEGFTSFW